LVAWTGEIKPVIPRPWERRSAEPGKKTTTGVANGRLDDLVEANRAKSKNAAVLEDAAKELVSLTEADKQRLTEQLNATYRGPGGKKYEMVPVWTLESEDGESKGSTGESPETQGRFRKYAEQGNLVQNYSNLSSMAITSLCPLDRDRRTTGDQVVERMGKT
jgi:hypothetical protein